MAMRQPEQHTILLPFERMIQTVLQQSVAARRYPQGSRVVKYSGNQVTQIALRQTILQICY